MQKINNKAATIFDVAEKAGVSRGTVDRVIYGRGRVSQQTRDKVQKAIEELNYSANANASNLASKKEYAFSCLIPEFKKGDYWEEMNNGFLAAVKDITSYSIHLTIHHYDQQDISSFLRESELILSEKPAGVIMNTVFREQVTEFCKKLEQDNIPYAFVDNKIDELDYTLYYGVDPYKSGALGAWLLTTRTEPREIALVRLLRDPSRKADPNRPRRHGFSDYIEDFFPKCKIHTVFIDPDKPESILATLESFFAQHPGIKQIAMTNSRIYLLGEYLRKHPSADRIVVGFDDLEKNLDCLKEGIIRALVTRHIPVQAYNALTTFAECIIRNKRPEHKNHFVHMDILTQMNLDNY
jgi:LacI family transcriptional regulator